VVDKLQHQPIMVWTPAMTGKSATKAATGNSKVAK
jgi:hypothetical protein